MIGPSGTGENSWYSFCQSKAQEIAIHHWQRRECELQHQEQFPVSGYPHRSYASNLSKICWCPFCALAQALMIFQIGGVNSKSTASLVLVLLSALSLVGSIVGALLVDRASRKKMMLISLGILLFGFAALSFFSITNKLCLPLPLSFQQNVFQG